MSRSEDSPFAIQLPKGISFRRNTSLLSSRADDASDFHAAEPVYEVLEGWNEPLDGCSSVAELPVQARGYVEFVERELDVEVSWVGTGAERERVLVR